MHAPESDSSRPQTATLLPLIMGYMPARVVHTAAHLGISDFLAAGPQTAQAMAQATNTSIGPLLRLLRAMASMDLLEDLGRDRYALTRWGANCVRSPPGSMRSMALMFGENGPGDPGENCPTA